MQNKKYLTTKEVMKLLGVSRKTIYNYVQRGILKPIKLSPVKLLFDIEDIIKSLESLKRRGK